MDPNTIKPLRVKSGLTKEDLREAVYKAVPNLTRAASKQILDEVFEEIIMSLANNEQVSFRGFGKFKVQHKRPRAGRNPQTQVEATIVARRVIKFAPSRSLLSKVNEGFKEQRELK